MPDNVFIPLKQVLMNVVPCFCCCDCGTLSITYALLKGRWLSLFIFFSVAALCYYIGLLLKRCMNGNPLIETYADVGELAFGKKGIIIATICTNFFQMHLCTLEDHTKLKGKILPTTWLKSLGLLAYVSFGGFVISLILVGCAFGLVQLMMWDFMKELFLTLCNSMKDISKFSNFVLSTINYGSMAILDSKFEIYTTLINPITKYGILISTIATAIEYKFPLKNSNIFSLLIRTDLVISSVFVALAIPSFGYIMEFKGAFLGINVSILLPYLCYLNIHKGYKSLG
ncbi:hypothetical protein M9H77_09976 [Catharanthus roseus]|uniref:Uncharacterized protein n=1 Tax=Catharanthus roseus TaxID=4058 RepID=A0ACC0C2B0_CATRO|nr:hypothetical protein M9H77_09976 [Catharanthus roseus]